MENKKTLAQKKVRSGVDGKLSTKSKYDRKVRSQGGGSYSANSPFNNTDVSILDISRIERDLKFKRGINFFNSINEDK